MEKRLYRSRENAVIGGVCGGIAEYLDVDPTIVRLIWAFSAFYGGIGILAYLVCLIVIPENRSTAQYAPAKPKEPDYQEGQGSTGKQPGTQVQQDAGVQPGAEKQHNNSEQHQPDSQYHHDSQRHEIAAKPHSCRNTAYLPWRTAIIQKMVLLGGPRPILAHTVDNCRACNNY